MNWLIVAPDKASKDLSTVKDFLNGKKDSIKELFICENLSKAQIEEVLKEMEDVSHCIILDTIKIQNNTNYTFLLGLLCGLKIGTFLQVNPGVFSKYEILKYQFGMFFKIYENVNDILSSIEKNYTSYEKAFLQKQALKDLMKKGIPFSADSFATFIEKDNDEMCQKFLEAGMDVNAFTVSGIPLLGVACRSDCINKVKWLLDNGADINVVSKDRGYTPVMDAVWRKDYDIVELLIQRKAKLNCVSSDGQPILVLAVGNGNAKIVELLLASGADADIKDSMGMSARGYANLFKKDGMVELFAKYPEK